MKKIILCAALMGSAAIASHAQANSVLVYGQVGYSSNKNQDDNKTRAFNISPGVGYQLDNHWTLGLSGSFNTNRTKSNAANADWNYSNSYGAGAFVRYTMPVSKIFALYNQFDAGYLGTTTNNGGGSNYKTNGFRASITPAVGINIINGFGLNLGFGGISYQSTKISGVPGTAGAFNFTFGSQFDIGISKNIFCGKGKRRHHAEKTNHGSNVDKEDMKDESED